MPAWHEFALVENKDASGRTAKLVEWKKSEADRILKDPLFKPLPEGVSQSLSLSSSLTRACSQMTRSMAVDSIMRKFTNYRNNRKEKPEGRDTEIEALKSNAAALFELRSFSKGKALFKKQKKKDILIRKAELMAADPMLAPIGALQKATKQLWSEAEQDHWEAQATSDADEIYE